MAYIGKQSLLDAYNVLSHNTSSPSSQGATQFVSAVRYLFALDRFVFKNNKDCDTKNKNDRDAFIEYVGDIVSINGPLYTSNFYTDLKSENDYKVGSNFFSVNVVKESLANPVKIYDFPRRSKDGELFQVRDGILSLHKPYLRNLRKYFSSNDIRIAFAIWLCRAHNFIKPIDYYGIRDFLYSKYSKELIGEFLPDLESFNEYLSKNSAIKENFERCLLTESDIRKLFTEHASIDKAKQVNLKYRSYITAIKSKPFLLLAGISGTGKSRIVRELARACWEYNSEEYKLQTPPNFKMVQVKPNWHDSTELIGYVSRVSGNPIFIPGEFLKFVVKAWEHTDIPYFLCLDEMNLAPVEQYFAEYLSVIESRKNKLEDDVESVVTDPIINAELEYSESGELKPKRWYESLIKELLVGCPVEKLFALTQQFLNDGISIPQNLIVVGTVNMDETTFSFSRKVLDRAMTIEMNEVDLHSGLTEEHNQIGLLSADDLIGMAVEGKDVYLDNQEVCEVVISYLQTVNQQLEGTPFKVAYRTRNEFLLYVINNLDYNKDSQGKSLSLNYIVARALDEITSMKILSRIEGDSSKVTDSKLKALIDTIELSLNNLNFPEEEDEIKPELHLVSVAKLQEMRQRLNSGYTSFWS